MSALSDSIESIADILTSIDTITNQMLANVVVGEDGKTNAPKIKDLVSQVSLETGYDESFSYALVRFFFDHNSEYSIRAGRYGGITKRGENEKLQKTKAELKAQREYRSELRLAKQFASLDPEKRKEIIGSLILVDEE